MDPRNQLRFLTVRCFFRTTVPPRPLQFLSGLIRMGSRRSMTPVHPHPYIHTTYPVVEIVMVASKMMSMMWIPIPIILIIIIIKIMKTAVMMMSQALSSVHSFHPFLPVAKSPSLSIPFTPRPLLPLRSPPTHPFTSSTPKH